MLKVTVVTDTIYKVGNTDDFVINRADDSYNFNH